MRLNERGNLTIALIVVLVLLVVLTSALFSKLAGIKLLSRSDLSNQTKSVSQKDTGDQKNLTPGPSAVIDSTIKFDVEKAKVGDTIGKMTITKLGGYKADKATNNSAFVNFTGQVTITGEVDYSHGGELGELVCMKNLDSESQAKMPKLTSQYYVSVSFCFDDLDNAKKLLVKNLNSENQGQATVVIDDYAIDGFPIEGYNTAKLISAVR